MKYLFKPTFSSEHWSSWQLQIPQHIYVTCKIGLVSRPLIDVTATKTKWRNGILEEDIVCENITTCRRYKRLKKHNTRLYANINSFCWVPEPVVAKMLKKAMFWLVLVSLLVAVSGGSESSAMSTEEKRNMKYVK
jgi:hypothetical protein